MNMFIYIIGKGNQMRKKDDKLRETLLDMAHNIAETEGIDKINIRTIAKKTGIASGTVYNYFSNKDDILLALTEEYWKQTLSEMKEIIKSNSFCDQIQEVFIFLKQKIDCSGGKLMNSLNNVEIAGQKRMASVQLELKTFLIQLIEKDPNIDKEIWNKNFIKERFIEFIMLNMMALLKTKEPDIDFLIIVINRMIY